MNLTPVERIEILNYLLETTTKTESYGIVDSLERAADIALVNFYIDYFDGIIDPEYWDIDKLVSAKAVGYALDTV